MEFILTQIYSAILNGQQKDVAKNVTAALHQDISPVSIMNDGMISAMQEVGRLFEVGEYYVPEMLVSARAMQSGMNVLKPFLSSDESHPAGKVAIGTVKGDIHDIGKNLVKIMMEGAGFDVIDLGVDVDPHTFVDMVVQENVNMIAMSALITTTMTAMIPVINLITEKGLRDKVKILVGGAPVTDAYAKQIAADGYAPDASRAVTMAKNLLSR